MGYGELFSVLSALFWALTLICYRKAGDVLPPTSVNLLKNLISVAFLLPLALLVEPGAWRGMTGTQWLLVCISGIIGLTADSLVFKCLAAVGAGRHSVLTCLYCVFVFLYSWLFFDEQLTALKTVGFFLTLGGVVWATTGVGVTVDTSSPRYRSGVLAGVLSMVMVATGVILFKPVVGTEPGKIPPLTVATIRVLAGFVPAVFFIRAGGGLRAELGRFHKALPWGWLVAGSFMGGVMSMITWVASFGKADAGKVAILNQTVAVFTLVLAALFLKERLTGRKLAGAVTASVGAVVLMWK